MTSISSITAVAPTPVASSQASHAATANTAATIATTTQAANTNYNVSSLTSRQIENPLAGILVTQTVANNGLTVNQYPSSTVVAYLSEGLTADGHPRPAEGQNATIA